MKILVIFTGGTIGSAVSDGWISPDNKTNSALISHYQKTCQNDIHFVTKEPYSILSENLSAQNINMLIDAVKSELSSGFNGIIITHGSDTLQYSAAALSFALGSCDTPVLLVSSNFPLENLRANGHANFAAAVEFIKAKAGKGVFVPYKNGDEPVCFHKAHRLLAHMEWDDCLYSVGRKCYGALTERGIIKNDLSDENDVCLGDFEFCDNPQILVVDSYPGANYNYNLDNCKAVILKPYHSGTLNTANPHFEKLCISASNKNIPVFAANANAGITYESSKKFDNFSIIPIYRYPFITAYIRLWIAISRNEDLDKIFN